MIYAQSQSDEIDIVFKIKYGYHNKCLVVGIPDFINRGIQVVSKFETVVNQIQKNERDIDSRLQSIVMANLLKFPVPDKSNDLPGRMNQSILTGYSNYLPKEAL